MSKSVSKKQKQAAKVDKKKIKATVKSEYERKLHQPDRFGETSKNAAHTRARTQRFLTTGESVVRHPGIDSTPAQATQPGVKHPGYDAGVLEE